MTAIEVLKILKTLVEEQRQFDDKAKAIGKHIKNNEEVIENTILDSGDIAVCRDLFKEIEGLEKEKKAHMTEVKKRKRTVEEIIMEEGKFDKEQLTFGELIEGF